jgi:DNA replication initiation complex subunit (GINS family)
MTQINIRIPKKLTPEERALYEQLAQRQENQPA